jgi:hypothetical protein
MSNFKSSGTLTVNGATSEVSASNSVTFSATTSGGTPGTLAWQFKGPDGIWTPILDGTTAIESAANYMKTMTFGDDVRVRGNLTGSTGATWVWQIMSNPFNRHG